MIIWGATNLIRRSVSSLGKASELASSFRRLGRGSSNLCRFKQQKNMQKLYGDLYRQMRRTSSGRMFHYPICNVYSTGNQPISRHLPEVDITNCLEFFVVRRCSLAH